MFLKSVISYGAIITALQCQLYVNKRVQYKSGVRYRKTKISLTTKGYATFRVVGTSHPLCLLMTANLSDRVSDQCAVGNKVTRLRNLSPVGE